LLPVIALALLAPAAFATAKTLSGASSAPPARGGPSCLGRSATIAGTPGDDKLAGTPGSDVIAGLAGADRISGRGGNDLVCAGLDDDTVSGGAGDDRLDGGADGDLLRGGTGQDQIRGRQGRDRLFGEGADDLLAGGPNVDRCDGGAGANELTSCETGPQGDTENPVVNRPPQATSITSSTEEDSPKMIAVASAGSDPDGDALSFSSLETSGTTGQVGLVDGGSALRFNPTGRFNSLAPGQTAKDSFGYTIADSHGGTANGTVTMTVTGVDDPPDAVDDEVTLEQNASATTIAVRSNDFDRDEGPKLVESVTEPAHGAAAVANGGFDVTYQPDPGYCNDGEPVDSFIYSLNGGSSASVEVTVACVTQVSVDQGGMFPEFDSSIADYTIRCDGSPLEVTGRLAQGSAITVDGGQPQTGVFKSTVPLAENQEFSFTLDDGTATNAYHVRCLPVNFPTWQYERLLPPRHDFYVVTPALGAGASAYAIVFDDHGVPLWWYGTTPGPIDAKFLANGQITWWGQFGEGDGYQIRELDGTVVHAVSAVGGSTDIHELQQEPNGDYLVISYQPREHVDLTAFDGGPDDTVVDAVVQEIDQAGQEVWSWSTQDHVKLDETGRWWPTALGNASRDIVHMNAVEPVGDDAILISLRHTDAVYKIDKSSGSVVWKLGGTWTPKSLTVKGDPQGAYPLGGQHDVRLQPDGTITIYDNNTNLPDAPRAVRYQIDEAAKTATLVEEVTDPLISSSFCCGSARRSADGSWLMSWGGRSLVTEFDSADQRTFKLGFGGTAFSYRAAPADGIPDVTALRAGMDSMHPRP
jgi:hypothetical protein